MRVRINVTCAGTVIALDEAGAVLRLPSAQVPARQSTLAIEDGSTETVYIPARVVRTEPRWASAGPWPEYDVVVEFLELSGSTATALERLIDGAETFSTRQ